MTTEKSTLYDYFCTALSDICRALKLAYIRLFLALNTVYEVRIAISRDFLDLSKLLFESLSLRQNYVECATKYIYRYIY